MDSQSRDRIVRVIAVILFVGILIIAYVAKDWTAAATFALALATFALAIDSSKNIEISKNSLIKEDLTREMEQIIKPLYNNRDRFGDYEPVYALNYSTDSFWKQTEINKYLATKDLRESIEHYLRENKELRQNLSSLENKIRGTYQKEKEMLPFDFYRIMENFVNFSKSPLNNAEFPEELRKLMEELNGESEIRSYFKEYINIIENNNLADIRYELRVVCRNFCKFNGPDIPLNHSKSIDKYFLVVSHSSLISINSETPSLINELSLGKAPTTLVLRFSSLLILSSPFVVRILFP